MRRLFLALAMLAVALPAFADKGRGGDDDDLNEARKRGDVLPLAQIMEKVAHVTGGRIVEIETERKHGAVLYGIYYLDAEGRRREIYVDARTGTIVESKQDD